MTQYDEPFFKILSRNDTGETGAHQGGVVLPRALSEYFPHLLEGDGPTADHEITAELYDGDEFIQSVQTRYQIQTWGGTRTPEHRLTRNLRPLLKRARAGDLLVFQRQLGHTDRFRLTLVGHASKLYKEIARRASDNWGIVTDHPPADQEDFREAQRSIRSDLSRAFSPVEPDEAKRLTLVQRRVRTELFKRDVRLAYSNSCAFCGVGLRTPLGKPEVEAAHIIPRSVNGPNDPRNGIALCGLHHWAFDNHLWSIDRKLNVIIPSQVRKVPENRPLLAFDAKRLAAPIFADMGVAALAIQHHREETLKKWGE